MLLLALERLGFGDLAGLECLGGNPDALYLPIGHANADALYIRLECALGDFRDMGTDPAALLGETFAVDPAAAYATFTGN